MHYQGSDKYSGPMNGKGKMVYANGDHYYGTFRNGYKHHEYDSDVGTMFYLNETTKFIG